MGADCPNGGGGDDGGASPGILEADCLGSGRKEKNKYFLKGGGKFAVETQCRGGWDTGCSGIGGESPGRAKELKLSFNRKCGKEGGSK